MRGSIFTALIPLFCLAFNCAGQVIIFRLWRRGMLKSIICGFCMGLAVLVWLDLIYGYGLKVPVGIFLVHALTYLCLGYCYFHFLNLTGTARRIRIMRELRENPQGLTVLELLARYNAGEIVGRRLSRLIDNGQVRLAAGRFFAGKPVIFWMAKVMVFMKLILLNKRSDFNPFRMPLSG